MNTAVYQALESSNLSWICCSCGIPNFSSSLFDSFLANSTNRYDCLHNSSVPPDSPSTWSSDKDDIGSPLLCSSPNQGRCMKIRSPTKLRLICLNMQSIMPKKESFWNLLESSNPDVVLANETWLKPTILDSELLPPGSPYLIYRKDRTSGYGGVLIALKNDLPSDPVEVNSDCEIICRNIQNLGGDSVLVLSAYRPPNNSKEYALDMFNAIKDICIGYPKSIFLLGGDLNLPDITWATNYHRSSIPQGHKRTDPKTRGRSWPLPDCGFSNP